MTDYNSTSSNDSYDYEYVPNDFYGSDNSEVRYNTIRYQ